MGVDPANLPQTLRIGREGRQRSRFIPNPTIRNRAFAAVRSDITVSAATTSSSLPAGSILRQPEEFRFTSSLVFQPSFTQWSTSQNTGNHSVRVRKSYGYNGDTTMTLSAPVVGGHLLRAEADILIDSNGDFEMKIARNGALCRLWVDEQPTQAYPTDLGGATHDNAVVFIRYSGLAPGVHRIMWEMEQTGVYFAGLVHRAASDLYPASLHSRGSLFWLGDSIGESATALMGNASPPYSQQYFAGGFINNLGHLLGLHQVYGAFSQGGTGLVRDGASIRYGGRIAVDVGGARPDAVAIQCSTNDAADSAYPAQIAGELASVVAAIKAINPDCVIFGVGPLGTPPSPDLYGATMTTVVTNFVAGCAAAGIPYVDTAGLFTGSRSASSVSAHNDGNADLYFSAFAADVSTNSPHPNDLGHARIARFLAPRIAGVLGIDLSLMPGSPRLVTPAGQWEA